MPVKVSKKKDESNEKLIKRFKRQTQGARIIPKVRNERYHKRPKTRRRVRDEALARENFRAIREKEKFYL